MQTAKRTSGALFWRAIIRLCRLMTVISCCALVSMMLLICGDILLRLTGHSVQGVYDVVRIAGVLTVACALPVTTAMKGHVAIEYFFRKLNRRGRLVVDSLMRLLMIAAFLLAAYECILHGIRFLKNGRVTDTIEIPIFWVPWVMALSFTVTALVVIFHLRFPGRSLIRS